jgi:Tfp pilus assembly protein PilO
VSDEALLAKLHDIYMPPPIGIWPLAVGWIVLLVMSILLLAWLGYFLCKRHRQQAAKRDALTLLDRYKQAYETEKNSQLSSMQVSELLRRVALVYFPRTEVAGLQGDAWIDFLTRNAKGVDFTSIQPLLLQAPYQPPQQIDLTPLFQKASAWIKQVVHHV